MWVVCDEILLVWKMNSEKYAGNWDKCAKMKDFELIVKAMSEKNLLRLVYCLGKLLFEMKE